MEFYKIESPTTEQFLNAILEHNYFTLEQLEQKVKQINVLLKDYFCTNEIFIGFFSVTNTGGYPIIFSPNCSIDEICAEHYEDFYSLNYEEQDEIISLFSYHSRPLNEFFV